MKGVLASLPEGNGSVRKGSLTNLALVATCQRFNISIRLLTKKKRWRKRPFGCILSSRAPLVVIGECHHPEAIHAVAFRDGWLLDPDATRPERATKECLDTLFSDVFQIYVLQDNA